MKNIAKALLVVSLLAGASMTSQVAMAAVPANTGSLAPTSQALVIDGTASTYVSTFGRTFTTGLNKLFSDSYTFSVLGDSETSGTVSATFTSSQDLYIKSFDIYDSVTNLVVVGGSNELLNSNGTKKNDFWSLPELSTLGAGNYYVLVTGQILGAAGGVYGGTLNVTAVTAVPEAETYAMMLAGLGLLGVVARRKAAKKAA